jgi:ABC-type sugar transport system substrate-binding protein
MSAHRGKINRKLAMARMMLLASLVLALAVVVGCGGSDDGDSSGNGGSASADVADKKIGWVDVIATSPIEQRWINAFKYATDEIGWSVEVQDAAGDPATALTATRNFINSGVDGIVNSSIASEWIRPAKANAESADIPLINLITEVSPGVYDADIDEDATEYSKALAEQIKEDYPDGAKLGVLIEGVIVAEQQRLKELKKALEGSNIEFVAEEDIPIADQPSANKATVDMMNANPDIDSIVAVSGVLPQYALPALRTLNDKDTTIYSWYADSLNYELMQRNPNFVAVVDSDIAKASFIAIDELLKDFTGEEMTEQQYVKVEPVIVTKEDLTPGMKKNEGPIPYSELIKPYLERWGADYGLGPDA